MFCLEQTFSMLLAELGRTVGANWLFVGLHRMVGANRIGRRLCRLRKVYPHHTRNLTKNQAPNFVLSHPTRNHSSRSENRMAKSTPPPQVPNQPPKLLDRVRIVIRLRNYSGALGREPKRRMSVGQSAISASTSCAIRRKWARRRSKPF